MEQDHKKQIEEIIGKIECPKDFKCYKSGFDNLCLAKDIGIESFLECLERNPQKCKFSFSFGLSYFCQCPLRVYIAKKLKK
jgi:hypothetical protein